MSKDKDVDSDNAKLSKKDYAKKLRREAYQRAKEYKKNDPREIARKAEAKEQRRAAYQKAKERNKAKKAKQPEVAPQEEDDRPLAPVISLEFARKKKQAQTKKPTPW